MGDTRSAQSVLTRLKNFVRVGTRTVTLVGTVNDWLWYGGDIQAKALLLMLSARIQPDSQLVLGIANDLLASNHSGHWENTSNAGWVLQAFAEMVAQQQRDKRRLHGEREAGRERACARRVQGILAIPVPEAGIGEGSRRGRETGAGAARRGRRAASPHLQPERERYPLLYGGAPLFPCCGGPGAPGRGHRDRRGDPR